MLQIIITLANVKIKAPQIFFSENVGEEYFLVYFCQATQNWFWRKKLQDFKYKLKKKQAVIWRKKKPSTQLFITVTITRVKSKNFSSIWRLLIKPVGSFNFICICYFKTKLATHSYQSSSQNAFCTHSSSLTSMPWRHSRVPQDT